MKKNTATLCLAIFDLYEPRFISSSVALLRRAIGLLPTAIYTLAPQPVHKVQYARIFIAVFNYYPHPWKPNTVHTVRTMSRARSHYFAFLMNLFILIYVIITFIFRAHRHGN